MVMMDAKDYKKAQDLIDRLMILKQQEAIGLLAITIHSMSELTQIPQLEILEQLLKLSREIQERAMLKQTKIAAAVKASQNLN